MKRGRDMAAAAAAAAAVTRLVADSSAATAGARRSGTATVPTQLMRSDSTMASLRHQLSRPTAALSATPAAMPASCAKRHRSEEAASCVRITAAAATTLIHPATALAVAAPLVALPVAAPVADLMGKPRVVPTRHGMTEQQHEVQKWLATLDFAGRLAVAYSAHACYQQNIARLTSLGYPSPMVTIAASSVAGKGLIASVNIKKGNFIQLMGGLRTTAADARRDDDDGADDWSGSHTVLTGDASGTACDGKLFASWFPLSPRRRIEELELLPETRTPLTIDDRLVHLPGLSPQQRKASSLCIS
jgi:hypothetical protein